MGLEHPTLPLHLPLPSPGEGSCPCGPCKPAVASICPVSSAPEGEVDTDKVQGMQMAPHLGFALKLFQRLLEKEEKNRDSSVVIP